MKTLILFVLSMILLNARAQISTVDPVLSGVIITNGIVENDNYSSIKSKQNAIEDLQATTIVITNEINKVQNKIFEGLLYVSETVKNAYQIYDCLLLLKSIYGYEANMISEAQQNPLALGFAVKFQREMVNRAIEYYGQIQAFILKEGDEKLLMDAGARSLFLTRILDNLRVIEAFALESYYKVHYAVMNGIINTLNPFGGFVNKDARIARDIINKMKF